MKLSELISKLQKLQAEHGDLPVMAYSPCEDFYMHLCDASKGARRFCDDFTPPVEQRELKTEHVIELKMYE